MQATIKEILSEVIEALEKVRCYTLRETLIKYRNGEIDADEAVNLLIEFNTEFSKLDVFMVDGEPSSEPISYIEFIKIGNTDLLLNTIKRLSTRKSYDFKYNKSIYEIVINEATNDFNPMNNIVISFDDEMERNKTLLRIKDKISVLSNVKFN